MRLLATVTLNPNQLRSHLLPLVSLFGLAVAFVCASLPRRAGQVLAAILLAVGALMQLGGLGLAVTRFYG